MPLIVAEPVISFLRRRGYAEEYGQYADYRYPFPYPGPRAIRCVEASHGNDSFDHLAGERSNFVGCATGRSAGSRP